MQKKIVSVYRMRRIASETKLCKIKWSTIRGTILFSVFEIANGSRWTM